MNRPYSLSLLALIVALPLAAQDQKHDLRMTAKAGSSVWIDRSTRQSQEIDMGGQAMETGNEFQIVLSVAVKGMTDDGDTIVAAKIERIRGKFTIPMMGDHEFDSIDFDPSDLKDEDASEGGGMDEFGMPDFDAVGRAGAKMVGTTLTAHVGTYGKVKSIEGTDAAWERLQKNAGDMGAQMLAAYFNPKALEDLVRGSFGERTEQPLAIGGTWERTNPQQDGGLTQKATMTLVKATDKQFEVQGAGTVTKSAAADASDGGEESEEEAMMREMRDQMKIENGKMSGRTVISREDGFLIESSSKMSLDMTMPGPLGGDVAIKQSVDVMTRRTTREAAMAGGKKKQDTDGKDTDK